MKLSGLATVEKKRKIKSVFVQSALGIRDLNNDDFIVIFENIPPIKDLIKIIPRSLPLLDAIYQKCESVNLCYSDIFRRYLDCDQLLNRILWWYAIKNQIPKMPILMPETADKTSLNAITDSQNLATETHIKSILGIIQRKNPEMIEEIYLEKSQLFSCLEALGCHGLINCSTGMVQLIEAVLYETIKLQEKVKRILTKIKEMQKQKFLNNSATKSSHQRQLSLKLSEIYDRLKQNEAIETIIIEIITNPRT
uniref:Uncharacterized protein n=1 Tax=Panagrolaimus sp. PS1159 TaxID=55785 RepID=A0AC35F5E2_9BILA